MNAPPTLIHLAKAAIRTCLESEDLVVGRGEVAEVARLVLQLPAELVEQWRQVLMAGELDVVGVFAHKKPQARFIDLRDKRAVHPELGDLLIVFDCEDAAGRARRALLIQAKVAHDDVVDGTFTIESGRPERQRYLYSHWPPFTVASLDQLPNPTFHLAPTTDGNCLGSRYACVNEHSPKADSGWWVEAAQPAIPANGVYTGERSAVVDLGEALWQMAAGKLGEPLIGDWDLMTDHVMAVACESTANDVKLRDVTASADFAASAAVYAAGTHLPHLSAASCFLANVPDFFDSKATRGISRIGNSFQQIPPSGNSSALSIEPDAPGFGMLYVRLVKPEWKPA